MKKLFTILLMISISINITAQIQRTFMGCSFGSTKQHVLQKMKAKGFDIENRHDRYIVNSTSSNEISFGGFRWDEIQFSFYNDALYTIKFVNYSDISTKKTLKDYFLLLKDKLESKYANYANPQISDGLFSWSDDKTMVVDRYAFIDKKGRTVEEFEPVEKKVVCALIYLDLESPKLENDDSEL